MTQETQDHHPPDQREIVDELADILGETKAAPRRLLARILHVCGLDFVEAVLDETRRIEANGGMMTKRGDRRRTTGGVFLYLAKGRMTKEQRRHVYPHIAQRYAASKQPKWLDTNRPPFDPSRRSNAVHKLLTEPGKADDVRVKIIGRPGWHQKFQEFVLTTMEHDGSGASIPGGLPKPDSLPTVYTIYINNLHWEKVEGKLKDPEKALEIEGMAGYDPDIPGIAVFATKVTVRKAKKKAPEAPKTQEQPVAEVVDVPPLPQLEIPPDAPPEIERKLHELYSAAQQYHARIVDLYAKPEGKRFGLQMTEKLLANTEQQIDLLLREYL